MKKDHWPEVLEQVESHVRREVAAGFLDESEIVENVLDVFGEEIAEDQLRPFAEKFTQSSLLEYYHLQETWPAITDCDRLEDAFADLEKAGIVCRQNFSCCGNCGVGEIWDEMDREIENGRQVRGYTFYHMQDTNSAVEGHGLYLHYGSILPGEECALEIGRMILAILTQHGLHCEWNGTWDTRIHIHMKWKRRRPVVIFNYSGQSRN